MNGLDGRQELDELKRRLDEHGDALGRSLYGEPTKRWRAEYRWGRRDSVQLTRCKGGWRWHDHETGESGSLLDAIRHALGFDLAGAVKWAREWLGGQFHEPHPSRATPDVDVDVDIEQERHGQQALAIWTAGNAVAGTLAERYLQRCRAISAHFPPEVARFIEAADVRRCRPEWEQWWRWPALVVGATDASGVVTGVQLIALEPDGTAVLWPEDGGKLKPSLGRLAGSAVRLPGARGITTPLLLAEEFESAASVWWASGYETWAPLVSSAKADLSGVPLARLILVTADDDPRNAPNNRGLNKVIAKWRCEGRTILVVKPWQLSRGDKSDFNDLLCAEGPEAVRLRIVAAVEQRVEPVLSSVEDARQEVSLAICKTLLELRAWRRGKAEGRETAAAPFKVVRAALGIGKTEITIEYLVDAVTQGERVAYLVPTHRLAAELQARFDAAFKRQGITARVDIWRGRAAANPAHLTETMCTELSTVREAQAAHLDARVVCKVCPHRETCPYLAQAERSADIWIGAHELLLLNAPPPLRGTTLLVIDEGFAHRVGVIGLGGKPLLLTRDDMLAEPSMKSVAATADLLLELMPLRRKFAAALDGHPEGGLDRDRLIAASLTADDCARACSLEWRAKREPYIKAWRGANKWIAWAAAANRKIGKRAMAWREAEALLRDDTRTHSARATWGQREMDDGATFNALRLCGIEAIDEAWQQVPTLNIDATANMTLLRARVSHAELVADINAATPHMQVVQYTGKTFGKGALHDAKMLDKAWNWAVALASRRGGEWLVALSKKAEKEIASTRPVPPFIRLAHFSALRGLDAHKDVAGVIIIGRPMPPPADVERLAGVLTGREVQQRVKGWYPTETVHLRAQDGTAATVEADRHPDHLAEAVRAAIAEVELIQAIGRARAVNRTAEDPVEVVLLGNVPVPGLALDSVQPWQAPSVDDEILAEHGVVFQAAAHAAAVVANVAVEAFKKRRQRLGTFSYTSFFYGNVPNLREATYQLAGAGHRPLRVLWEPRRVPDIRGFLEAKLGTLAHFELHDAQQGATQAGVSVEVIAEPVTLVPLAARAQTDKVTIHRLHPSP